jgi:hypothetical protein
VDGRAVRLGLNDDGSQGTGVSYRISAFSGEESGGLSGVEAPTVRCLRDRAAQASSGHLNFHLFDILSSFSLPFQQRALQEQLSHSFGFDPTIHSLYQTDSLAFCSPTHHYAHQGTSPVAVVNRPRDRSAGRSRGEPNRRAPGRPEPHHLEQCPCLGRNCTL